MKKPSIFIIYMNMQWIYFIYVFLHFIMQSVAF